MSFLQNALSAVKTGLALETSGQQIDKAMLAYQEAIYCFQEVAARNELKNEEYKNELQRQLKFYSNKVHKLKLQRILKMAEETVNDGEKELIEKIILTILNEKPVTKFSDVAGVNDVKDALQQAIVLPIKHPELFSEDLTPYKSFLLFGATGTGKSYLAKALASECTDLGTTFFSLSPSDLMSQYEGQSEKLVKTLFQTARLLKPSVIFIDEVDTLVMARKDLENSSQGSTCSELRIQMKGTLQDNSGVFVLATTRNPQNLDDAFLRRFDRLLHIALPDEDVRFQLFQMQFKSNANISERILRKAAVMSKGLSGSDISVLAKKARMMDLARLQKYTHFKRIQKDGKTLWRPCSSNDADAVKTNLDNIPPHGLQYKLKPNKEDVLQCVRESRPTANKAAVRSLELFAEKYGEVNKRSSANDKKKAGKFLGIFNKVFK